MDLEIRKKFTKFSGEGRGHGSGKSWRSRNERSKFIVGKSQ